MDLIRAYADKVAGYLPRKMRQETADELYDSLCEQFADSEQPDTEAAVIDFIQQQPHPIRMATRLGQNESLYLIGPGFYLSFIEGIKIAALVAAVIHVAVFALSVWAGEGLLQAFVQALMGYPGTLLNAVVIIGLVFVVLERSGGRADWLDKWNPRDLKAHAGYARISKPETLFELNISAIVLLWITGAIELPGIIRIDGTWLAELITNVPDWLIAALVVLLVSDIVMAVAKLARGVWLPSLRALNLVSDVLWIGVLVVILQIDPLITAASVPEGLRVEDILVGVNTGFDIGLIIAIVITGWDAVTQLYHLFVKKPLTAVSP